MGLLSPRKTTEDRTTVGTLYNRIGNGIAVLSGATQQGVELDLTPSWTTLPPPVELFEAPHGTSMEIESILEASIQKLQAQIENEDQIKQLLTVVDAPLGTRPVTHQRNGSALSNQSKGKERSHRGRYLPDMASQGTPSLNSVGSNISHRPASNGSPSRNGTSTAVPEMPPPYEEYPSADRETPTAFLESSPAPQPTSIYSAMVPAADAESSSASKWGLHRFRPYVSTLFKPAASSSRTMECVSCMESFRAKDIVSIVCHDYCSTCFALLIETSISSETSWPPKCCLNEIPANIVVSNVSFKLGARYEDTAEERSIPIAERIYCSKPSCSSWIPLANIDKSLALARCSRCRHKTCIACRGSYHSNGECPEDPNLQATLRHAINEGWRRCYKCNALVEHHHGCSHMTCRCKAQFCYICGLRWRTCDCTEEQLQTYLATALSRRRALQDPPRVRIHADYLALEREAEVEQNELANELREILHVIDRFEQEEGGGRVVQDSAVRDAQARATALALERRAEEDRDKSRRDYVWRLRMELDTVHSIQQTVNFDRYEAKAKAYEAVARKEIRQLHGDFEGISQFAFLDERKVTLRKFYRSSNIDIGATGIGPIPFSDLGLEGGFEYRGKKEAARLNKLARSINVALEAKLEPLRVAYDSDQIWFREVKIIREEMLGEMAMDEYGQSRR